MDKNTKSFKKIVSETRNNFEKLLKKEGMITGEVFRTQLNYIKAKKGEEGLDAFAKKAKELGKELDLRQIRYRGWYPMGLRPYAWIVMFETFGWGRKELIDSGYQAPKTSFVMRILAKYFISAEAIIKKSPHYWKKHYTIGDMEVNEVDSKKGRALLRIKNFKVSPLFCIFYLGYFKKVVEFGGVENVQVKQNKCVYNGDAFHEFLITWDV